MISFVVFGNPQPGGSKRAFPFKRADGSQGVRVTDANPKAADWKGFVSRDAAVAMAGRALLTGPLVLRVVFYRPRPKGHFNSKGELNATGRNTPFPIVKPDATKLMRSTEDAMIGVVFRDDSQVIMPVPIKLYGTPARAVIDVWQMTEDDVPEDVSLSESPLLETTP